MNQPKNRQKTDAFEIPADLRRKRFPFRVIASALVLLLLLPLIYGFYLHCESFATGPRAHYPHQIDHGEGLMLQLWRMDHTGQELYGPIEELPWVVNNYPPLYTFLVSHFSNSALDALAFGRKLSFCALLLTAIMLALIVIGVRRGGMGKPTFLDYLGGILAGTFLVAAPHFFHWGTLMRVDMLGLGLAMTGLAFVSMAGRRKTWPVVVAGIFFVAALATKHSLVAAPLAVVLGCLNHRRRRAVKLSCWLALSGGLLFAIGWWKTDGELANHLIRANRTAWSFELCKFHAQQVWQELGQYIVLAFLATGMSLAIFLSEYRQKGRTARLVVAHYLWLTAVGLLMTGKSGSNSNYYLEFYAAIAIACGLFVADLVALPTIQASKNLRRRVPYLAVLIVFEVIFIVDIPKIPLYVSNFSHHSPSEKTGLGIRAVTKRLHESPGPILSQDMSLPVLAGKDAFYHPFLMPDLARRGLWNDSLLNQMVKERRFPVVILPFALNKDALNEREKQHFAAMFTLGTLQAIYKHYEFSMRIDLPPFADKLYLYKPKM